jgi:hypothetical protein
MVLIDAEFQLIFHLGENHGSMLNNLQADKVEALLSTRFSSIFWPSRVNGDHP